ncbi:MAG TPA: BON domain-containing protein [Vicinamibacterales bacterium]|nr:BON domain-containing protein [Vicinamibacterales bacterium]
MKRWASALLVLTLTAPLTTACGAAATRANVSAPVDDATITTRVKTAFINDPVVGAAKIDVDTFKGVVTLSGQVKNKDEEQKAISLARSIRGVTDVKSTLQVQ